MNTPLILLQKLAYLEFLSLRCWKMTKRNFLAPKFPLFSKRYITYLVFGLGPVLLCSGEFETEQWWVWFLPKWKLSDSDFEHLASLESFWSALLKVRSPFPPLSSTPAPVCYLGLFWPAWHFLLTLNKSFPINQQKQYQTKSWFSSFPGE